jgi:hypothetical protein
MTRFRESSFCLCLYWLTSVEAFVGPSHHAFGHLRTIKNQFNGKSISRRTFTEVSFFRRKNTDTEGPSPDTTNGEPSADETDSQSSSLFNFMKRNEKKSASTAVEDSGSDPDSSATTTTVTLSASSEIATPLNATEEAARLRSEADRARLDAERLDAELTLRKIDRLEKELASMSAAAKSNETNGKASSSRKSPEDIQRELDGLMRKVRGDSGSSTTSSNTSQVGGATLSSATKNSNPSTGRSLEPAWPKIVSPFQQEEYDKIYNNVKDLPQFVKGSMALIVEAEIGVDPVTGKTLVNVTDLADRLDRLQRRDLSFLSKKPPTFTAADVSRALSELTTTSNETGDERSSWSSRSGDDEGVLMIRGMLDENEQLAELMKTDPRTFAQFVLEVEYYFADVASEETAGKMLSMASEEPWLRPFVNELQFTAVDTLVSNLFPKCTTKRDSADKESQIPTEAQVNQLVADILPQVNFRSTSKPEAVLGGYIIRGSTSLGGDALIAKIDSAMDRSHLKDKMTVLYVEDFTGDLSEAAESVSGGLRPILYVVSPTICRDSKPLQLSIVSAIGLATSWYLSIYPFLFNPKIAARVDEQLALADANMVPDLAWLTDLSVPLFATFIGIQLFHELGHLLVAGSNRIQTGSPTFVPSLLTGVTSTVTTFKTPPLNKAAMFDFSVAGPLFGVTASLLAIVIGAQLTIVSDPSLLPALPLEILRQSTLGGGLLDMGLGGGALNVPEGARGTAAVAGMTVPLHPVAVAGYISLIVNALAVLPVGSKYTFIRADVCSTQWLIV